MIENPNNIDIFGIRADGGADLLIVSSKKPETSAEAQEKLLDKIENYLGYINSDEFRTECPNATVQSTRIILQLSEDPPALILNLADQIIPWAAENNATFTIEVKK